MKLRMAVTVLALVAGTAGTALAAGSTWIGGVGGISFPVADFGNVASAGFHLGLTGDYLLSDQFSVGGDFNWHHFSGKSDYEKTLSALAGVPVNVTDNLYPFLVHGKFWLPGATDSKWQPYLKGGVGFYSESFKVDRGVEGTDTSTNTDFGFAVGGGAMLKSTKTVAFGLEGLYHYIATSGTSTNMLTLSGVATFDLTGGR